MRLLKYPLDISSSRLTALTVVGDDLLVLSNDGLVTVWSQESLVNTAFDKLSIKDLTMLDSFQLNQFAASDDEVFFLLGANGSLIVGTEHEILRVDNWRNPSLKPKTENDTDNGLNPDTKSRRVVPIFNCKSPCTITDCKLDQPRGVLIILTGSPNTIRLFDVHTCNQLAEIKLDEKCRPITVITDPVNETFTAFCSDRSILIYQFNTSGSLKQLNKLDQIVQVQPLHYRITMPPQGDFLPAINSVKGALSTSVSATVLLDRNKDFKVASTIVSPASNSCKVLVYSPVVYEKINKKKGTKTRYNLLATSGSIDGTILVWNTKRMKPLFNALQLSDTPINDIAWSNDGHTLFAVSDDKVLYTFAFQPGELGKELPSEELSLLRQENRKLTPLPEIKVPTATTATTATVSTIENTHRGNETITDVTSLVKRSAKKNTAQTPSSAPVKVIQGFGMEFNKPSYVVPKDLKRKPKEATKSTNLPGHPQQPPTKKARHDLEPVDFLDTGLFLPNASFSRIRLATPKIRMNFKYVPVRDKNYQMTVKNGSGNEQQPTMVRLSCSTPEQDTQLFQDLIPKFITLCTGGDSFWACCSDDGVIYVYSDTGKRLLPPMTLGVPISFLEASADYLLCVSSIGEMYCWNIKESKLHFPVSSVFPILNPAIRYSDDILTRAENITMCAVTRRGVPIVTLSSGDGYMYDKDLETWLLVSDSWWAYGSQYWDMSNLSSLTNTQDDSTSKSPKKFWNSNEIQQCVEEVKSDSGSIVNYMERKTNDELTRKGRIRNLQRFARAILIKEGFENMEEIVSLSHLENRLLISLRLEEEEEFSRLLTVYCVRLSELGYADRLEDVLIWLYGDEEGGRSKLLGKPRREFLESVLLSCAKFRGVQRKINMFAEAIGLVDEV